MLKLPTHFDQNEWFIIAVILLSLLMYIVLPKRFPMAITAIIVLYSISIPKIFDLIFALPPYDYYDLTDTNKYELFDLLMYAIYLPFGYLFIYIYDFFKFKGASFVVYIIFWSFLAIGTEFISVKLHVFNYHEWKLIYSLPIYTLILIVNVFLFNYCMKYFQEHIPMQSSE